VFLPLGLQLARCVQARWFLPALPWLADRSGRGCWRAKLTRSFPLPVLHFSNELVRAGVEEHMLTLLRELDRKCFRPLLVCPPECAEKLGPDLPSDVEVLPLSLQTPDQVGAAFRFAQFLRRQQVAILHSHLFRASLVASPIGWLCRVPVILETPHVREAWRKGWLKGSFFVDRFAGQFVDRYIAVSAANARFLIEEKQLPARKVQIIHNGSDLRKFDPKHLAPAGMKQALGFDESDPVLVVVGRLEPQKGHSVMLEAHAQILKCFPRVRLVCIGEGALRQQLQARVEALGIRESVRFVGFQRNVADWLAMADISILPSFFEGLPLAAIESLAAGRPIVATEVDGTLEVVINEKTGLSVPHGQAKALANAILRLLGDPELAKELAHAGRRWVEEHFSQEQQIQRTENLYLQSWERSSRGLKHKTADGAVQVAACDNREGRSLLVEKASGEVKRR